MSAVALVRDEDIDFDKYLNTPEEAAKVIPAAHYVDQVVEHFLLPTESQGAYLPWRKVGDYVRIRPGELSIWGGVNGHGKSMMLNFIMLALMAQGQKACIASFEMKPIETLKRMTRQFVGVAEPATPYIRDFHSWLHNRLWMYDQMGGIKPDRMIAVCRYVAIELGMNQIIIDSLMKCGIADDDYRGQKEFCDELQNVAKDTGMHIHLVHHARKGETEHKIMDKFDFKGTGGITDLADNAFIVWRNKAKEKLKEKCLREGSPMTQEEARKPDYILKVDKQRHGEWEGSVRLWSHTKSFQFVGGPNASPMNDEDWKAHRWT